jgi:hypothetical protein
MGDGVSELLRVVCAPCRRHGGLFDQTQDLQQIGSVLTRGLLDNLYITNRSAPSSLTRSTSIV